MIFKYKHSSFHAPGKPASEEVVSHFGKPEKSLISSTNLRNQSTVIVDENNRTVYRVRTEYHSKQDKTVIRNSDGKFIANIERKNHALRFLHIVEMEDGTTFRVKLVNRLFGEALIVEELGWEMRSGPIGLACELYDKAKNIIAVITV